MSDIHVEALYAYPIKSCGPLETTSFDVGPQGLAYDRQWVLTRPNGLFISQRTDPELALVQTALRDEVLLARTPDGEELPIPLHPGSETAPQEREIEIFKKVGSGVDEGDVAAAFFSHYLGKPVRLWRNLRPRQIKPERRVAGAGADIGFADGFPALLTSMGSLRTLLRSADGPIDMRSFRPNIVVDGSDLPPYREDYWRRLHVGEQLQTIVVRACARCPIPNIDQSRGVLPKPAERITTQALQRSRRGIDPLNDQEEVFFGQNLIFPTGTSTRIAVGDKVTVLDEAPEPNFLPPAG